MSRFSRADTTDRRPLTPAARRAWAIFIAFCESRGISRGAGRHFVAEEMGIEHYYVMRDEMDDVEAATFAEVCSEAMEKDAAAIEAATAKKPKPRPTPKGGGYLIRKRGKSRTAHIWTGTDTVCRMASTGGLKMENYEVSVGIGNRAVCPMCQNGQTANVLAAG